MKSLNNLKITPLNTSKVVKRFWFIPAIIMIIAIIVASICGLNLSLDFANGRQFDIVFNDTLEEDVVKDYKNDIKSIIKDNDVVTYKVEYLENNLTSRISVTIKDKAFSTDSEMEDLLNKIRTSVADKLNIDLTITENYTTHITEVVKYYPPYKTINFLWGALILLAFMVAIFVYAWIRFGITYSITTFLGLIFDMFMTVSFVIIARIPVYVTFVIPLTIILLLSTFLKFIVFGKMKEIIKLDVENKYTDVMYVDKTFDSLTLNLMTVTIITFVLLVLYLFVGITTTLWYILPMIFGVVALVVSTIYVTMASWSKIYNKNKDKRLLEKKKKTENDDVVV